MLDKFTLITKAHKVPQEDLSACIPFVLTSIFDFFCIKCRFKNNVGRYGAERCMITNAKFFST